MTTAPVEALSVTVVVITYERPAYVRTCLEHLGRLTRAPAQTIIVDASSDSRTRDLVAAEYPHVTYLRNDLGPGTMPESRQIGLAAASGAVVAFIDDDAFVYPDWLDELTAPYSDPTVVGVGGRAINGMPGEETAGLGSIGRLLPNGLLIGNFAADPQRDLDVDHLLGANMSFRRGALLSIGGIRGNYPGTCVCEESDISLRLRMTGGRLVFAPRAIVRHVAAPYQVRGERFDRRYRYYYRRNSLMLLIRVYGWRAPIVGRFVVTTMRQARTRSGWVLRTMFAPDRPGGGHPSVRERLRAPFVLVHIAIDAAGLIAGAAAAVSARAADRKAGQTSPHGVRLDQQESLH